ncbi:MAG TPA: hypothetical protein HA224_02790 [Nanoarchaeota archaeon]|nr:hypothetical protein [Nanoarchaeota archaeon]
MKRAQGLPISTIVLAIVGLLVLFMIIAFFTGAFGKVSGNVREAAGTTADVQATNAQNKCAQWCLQLDGLATDDLKRASAYCSKTQTVTVAGAAANKNCWQDPIFSPCEGAPAKAVGKADCSL